MQNSNTNRSFLFAGNFPVYNANNGLTDGQSPADFTINGRILYEFDTISLRFDAFNGNPYLCNLSIGRPFAVEFNLGGLAALISLISERELAPEGKFLPLAVTAYNQDNTTYQTIGYVSVTKESVIFYASNGQEQKQFEVKGNLQLKMLVSYLKSLEDLAISVLAQKEARKMNRGNGGGYTAPSATPSTTAAPSTNPAPSATPSTTAVPNTNPAPGTAAPTIDMPEINI